jgi:hypothetical protein
MKSARGLPVLVALAVVACGSEFDPGSRVTTLRLLAVHADHPFAAPGETVALDALAFDPYGGTPPVTWAWSTCVNPAVASATGCLEKLAQDAAGGAPLVRSMGIDQKTFSFTVPVDAISSLPREAAAGAHLGVITVACPGRLGLRAPDSGALPFVCSDATSGRDLALDEYVIGVKRIFVRTADRNQNPIIDRVTWDGDEWAEADVKQVSPCETTGNDFADCEGADQHAVAAVAASESYEAGIDEYGTPFTEQLIAQYYATEGIFENDTRIARDPATHWVARTVASGRTLSLFFVVRDNRGGVAWATRSVSVR